MPQFNTPTTKKGCPINMNEKVSPPLSQKKTALYSIPKIKDGFIH